MPHHRSRGRRRSRERRRPLRLLRPALALALLAALLCADSVGITLLPGTSVPAAADADRPLPGPTPATPAPAPRVGPRIEIEDVGLVAPLDPIRFEGSVLNPPEDVRRAGIWSDGAALDAAGTSPTVITGHVSDPSDRAGEFLKLWEVEPGDRATTVDAEGATRTWQVVDVRHVAKDDLSRTEFLPGDERVLRLITCASREGGDSGAFHYADNLIVDLRPV